MKPAPAIRILILFLALGACADPAAEREGLGPRGTALPPPDPVTGEARSALPAR